ncbi:MAG: preprotein translocase subunit SecA [Spirochaetia bacterium]|nr:preprotein translocase subunit SecA [Spirochaetia bacterium]
MLEKTLKMFFGTKHERDIRRILPLVETANSMEPEIQKLSDEELGAKTDIFKKRLAAGETLDDILPEAFAVVREAAWRTLGLRHFDVQLIGGIVLHQGKIAEMKTGEGKTLTSTLAVYLNSLSGKGVHIVTVNDYLAKRDANWMKPIYDLLNVSVGIIQHDMDFSERKEAYSADITYGTNNEYGFDFLRDNMVSDRDYQVQRKHNFAIVDEVDSILVDEARTPLIISGPTEENTEKYGIVDKVIRKLVAAEETAPEPPPKIVEPGKEEPHVIDGWYFDIDEKSRNVMLTDEGVHKIEELLNIDNLYAPDRVDYVAHVSQALKAHLIFKDEVDYVVRDNEVIIVDEHTGRLMEGRRYSDGLHQAIEAKEHVEIKQETQTLASITFQNFFRIYSKLSGMTGTADTEAEEFKKIYGLEVVVIPTNVPVARKDFPDRVYRTEREKFIAIADEIKNCIDRGQPVLVGTVSIEKSETLSRLLKKEGIQHNVLNAKQHQREAEVVENAGKTSAVTIATNMAGRGTDIVLGGAPAYLSDIEELEDEEAALNEFKTCILKKRFDDAEACIPSIESSAGKRKAHEIMEMAKVWLSHHNNVLEAGGLHIIGTERHESRRIDNQLRGRSGRQGDPGSSRFYLSLEDNLMRIFGGPRIMSLMEKLGMQEGQELEAKMVDRAIERAQKRVESHNFDMRKHLLEYDDVMNRQREYVYEERNKFLDNNHVRENLLEWTKDVLDDRIQDYCPGNDPHRWNLSDIQEWLQTLNIQIEISPEKVGRSGRAQKDLFDLIWNECERVYNRKVESVGEEAMNYVERRIGLDIIDSKWKEHLYSMDHLREGIWATSYSERNPLVEYKLQGFRLFDEFVASIKDQVTEFLFRVQIDTSAQLQPVEIRGRDAGTEMHNEVEMFSAPSDEAGNASIVSPSMDGHHGRKGNVTSVSGGGSSRRKSSRKRR